MSFLRALVDSGLDLSENQQIGVQFGSRNGSRGKSVSGLTTAMYPTGEILTKIQGLT